MFSWSVTSHHRKLYGLADQTWPSARQIGAPRSSRADDSPLAGAPNGHRLAAQLGIIALFDGRVERIHINVDYLSRAARCELRTRLQLHQVGYLLEGCACLLDRFSARLE